MADSSFVRGGRRYDRCVVDVLEVESGEVTSRGRLMQGAGDLSSHVLMAGICGARA
jgi:hypothetical protein